jgi:hypothetical protein
MEFKVDINNPNKQLEAEVEVFQVLASTMFNEPLSFKFSGSHPMEASKAKIEALRLFALAATGGTVPVENQMPKQPQVQPGPPKPPEDARGPGDPPEKTAPGVSKDEAGDPVTKGDPATTVKDVKVSDEGGGSDEAGTK